MPAEILQETAPGLVLVHLPDGSQRELPLDLAQQVVAESYSEGPPSYAQSAGQGAVPPVQQETLPPDFGYTLPPDTTGGVPSSTPEIIAPEAAAASPPAELAAPPTPPAVTPPPPGLLSQRSSVSATVPLGDPRRAGAPPPTPNLQQGLDLVQQGAYDQLRGQELESEAQALTGLRTSELNRSVQLANQEERAWQEKAGLEAQKEALEYRARYEEALNQVPNMNPGRFWQNLGGFGQALAMVSAGIGGMLQVTQGGPNRALDHINQLVEQDLRSQETDIATAREKVYRVGIARGMAREDTAQMFQDRAAQFGFRMKALIAAGDADIAKYQSPIAQANWFKMRGKMLESLGGAVNQVGQQAYNNSLNRWSAIADIENKRGQLRVARMNAATNRMEAKARIKASEKSDPVPHLREPGTQDIIEYDQQVPLSKESIGKLYERQAARRDIGAKLKDYYTMAERVGRKYRGKGANTRLGDADAALLEAKFNAVVAAGVKAESGAAFTKEELEVHRNRVGAPPGLVGQLPNKKITSYLQELGDRENTEFDQLGATKNGKKYTPGTFYAVDEGGIASETSLSDLRLTMQTDPDPATVAGAIEGFADLGSIPENRGIFETHLPEEVEDNYLRAKSAAKLRNDNRTMKRLDEAYKAFNRARSSTGIKQLPRGPEEMPEVTPNDLLGPSW